MTETIPIIPPDPNNYDPTEWILFLNSSISAGIKDIDHIVKSWQKVHPPNTNDQRSSDTELPINPIKIIVEPSEKISRGKGNTGRTNPITGTNETDHG